MDKISELSFRHLISQLQDENRQLREEVKWLRLSIKNYLNGNAHED
nr:MAG TPA: Transcription factor HY5 leucine zipper, TRANSCRIPTION.0A [Caudoviricetes sp.]